MTLEKLKEETEKHFKYPICVVQGKKYSSNFHFYRICIENRFSGDKIAEFLGKTHKNKRYAAYRGYRIHKQRCKKDWDFNNEWNEFKKKLNG